MVHVLLAMGPHLFSLFWLFPDYPAVPITSVFWGRKSEEALPDSSLQGSQENT